MIPIFCNRRFNFLAGAELNRICAANECGGKNKTAKYAPRISKSIHHHTVPLAKARATGAVGIFLARRIMMRRFLQKRSPNIPPLDSFVTAKSGRLADAISSTVIPHPPRFSAMPDRAYAFEGLSSTLRTQRSQRTGRGSPVAENIHRLVTCRNYSSLRASAFSA